jgi:hypothetical protein
LKKRVEGILLYFTYGSIFKNQRPTSERGKYFSNLARSGKENPSKPPSKGGRNKEEFIKKSQYGFMRRAINQQSL